MIARLQRVQPVLTSGDITSSVRFFDKLGFREFFRDEPTNPRYAGVRRDEVELLLQWHEPGHFADAVDRPTYRFVVSDVDALYAEFLASGALRPPSPVPSPWASPADTPWGTREFHVLDPDGNGLQFYRPL